MAIDWSGGSGSATGAPGGYGQNVQRASQGIDWGNSSTTQATRTPRWLTGGQLGSQENAWDTPFYSKMFQQIEEASQGGIYKPNALYGRRDYTGIVANDAMEKRTIGLETGAKFGDIFEDGKKVGNLYDSFDKNDANAILIQLMADPETQRQTYKKSDPEAIDKEIQRLRSSSTKDLSGFLTQSAYQENVDKEQARLLKDDGVTAATVLAGAAGGAAWGAGIGAALAPVTLGASVGVGAVIGGVIGGVGSLMNRDQISEMMARANVQSRMEGSNASTNLMNWSMLAQQSINPLTNFYQGAWEHPDHIGDGESAFYEVDKETGQRKVGALGQAGNLLAGFGDAAGLGGKVAGGVFQLTMAGTIAGKVGELTIEGGEAFDERAGIYRNYYDEGSNAASAWGATAMDAVQVGMFRGLAKSAAGGPNRFFGQPKTEQGWDVLSGIQKANPRVPQSAELAQEIQGLRFFAKRTADGKIEIIDKVYRPVATYLAPSEAVDSIAPAFLARVRARAKNSGAVTADDVYRTTMSLANSTDKKLAKALINGFGEGLEEGIQAYLEPNAFGYENPDAEDLLNSVAAGFVMGAGMSTGMSGVRGGNIKRQYARYEVLADVVTPAKKMDFEEFKAMSDHERNLIFAGSEATMQFLQDAAVRLESDQRAQRVATDPEYASRLKAAQIMQDKDLGRANSAINSKMQISGAVAGEQDPEALSVGLEYMQSLMAKNVRARELELQQLPESATQEQRLLLERVAYFVQKLEAATNGIVNKYRAAQAADNQAAADQAVEALNKMVADHYRGRIGAGNLPDTEILAMQRAATLMAVRYPFDSSGSLLAWMPQVDKDLARENVNNQAFVSHAVLKLLSGDFDGDTLSTDLTSAIDMEKFEEFRAGFAMRDVKGELVLRERDFSRDYWAEVSKVITNTLGTRDQYREAKGLLKKIRKITLNTFDGLVPASQLEDVLKDFRINLQAYDDGAYEKLYNSLYQLNPSGIMEAAKQRRENLILKFDDAVIKELIAFHRHYSYIEVNTLHEGEGKFKGFIAAAKNLERPNERRKQEARKFATIANDLANVVPGGSIFRKWQQVFATPQHTLDITAAEYSPEQARLIIEEYYAAIQNLINVSELEARDPSLTIISQANNILREMLSDIRKQSNGMPMNLALVAQLQMYMPTSFKENGEPNTYGAKGTLLQSVVWKITQSIRSKGVMSEALANEVAQWEALTTPGRANEMFMRFAEAIPNEELGGQNLGVLGGNLTMGQIARSLKALPPEAKSEVFRGLKRAAEYTESSEITSEGFNPFQKQERHDNENPKGVTAYRVMVDALAEEVNRTAPYDNIKGLVGGTMGDLTYGEKRKGASLLTTEKLMQIFRELSDSFKSLSGLTGTELTAEQVAEAKTARRSLAEKIADLIPVEMRHIVFPKDSNGVVHTADWLDKVFTMKPEKAVVYFWVHLQLSKFEAIGANLQGKDKDERAFQRKRISDRFSLLLFDLYVAEAAGDHQAGLMLRRLFQKMDSAQDINDLIRFINTSGYINPDEVPMIAWNTSVDSFDPDKAGFQAQSFADAEFQEALDSLAQESSRFYQDIMSEQNETAEVPLTANLLEELEELEKQGLDATEDGSFRLKNLNKILTRKILREPVEGRNAMYNHAFAIMRGGDARSHVKAQAPEHSSPLGVLAQKTDVGQYGTGIEELIAGATSTDMEDLLTNLPLLMKGPLEITLPDGRQIIWTTNDLLYTFLEKWKNPASRSVLRAIFFPSVWDTSGDLAVMSQKSVGPTSLVEMTSKDFVQSLFSSNANKSAYAAALTERVNAHGNGDLVMTFLLDAVSLAQVPASSRVMTAADIQRTIRTSDNALIDLSKHIGQLSPEMMAALRDLVKKKHFGKNRPVDEGVLHEIQELMKTEEKKVFNERWKAWSKKESALLEQIRVAQNTGAPDSLLAKLVNEAEDHKTREPKERTPLLAGLTQTETLDVLVERYGLWASSEPKKNGKQQDPTERSIRQANLLNYVHLNWNSLQVMSQNNIRLINEAKDLIRYDNELAQAKAGRKVRGKKMNPSTVRRLYPPQKGKFTDEDWHRLSNLVITHSLREMSSRGPMSTWTTLYPGMEDPAAKFYDGSYGYLVDMIFDPDSEFYKGSRDLWLEARGETSASAFSEAMKAADRFFEPEKGRARFPRWDLGVAMQTQNARSILRASSSDVAVPEAGNIPKMDIALAKYSARTMIDPGPLALSDTKFNITVDAKGSAELPQGAWDLPISIKQDETSWVKVGGKISTDELQGAIVSKFQLYVGNKLVHMPREQGAPTANLEESLWGQSFLHQIPQVDENGAKLPYRSLSMNMLGSTLPREILNATDDQGVPLFNSNSELIGETFTVDLSFFHGDSIPSIGTDRELYGNSLAFEGVYGEAGMDSYADLISAGASSSGGFMARFQSPPIQSMKKSIRARGKTSLISNKEKLLAMRDWKTDLSESLRLLLNVVMSKDIDGEYFQNYTRKYFYKRLRLSHWVRGTKDGEGVLLPAEEVIQLQKLGTLDSRIDTATMELIQASPRKLRTMLGEVGDQGLPSQRTRRTNDVMDLETRNLSIEDMIKRDPSLMDFRPTKDLIDYLISYVRPMSAYTSNGQFSQTNTDVGFKKFELITSRAERIFAARGESNFAEAMEKDNLSALAKAKILAENERTYTAGLSLSKYGYGTSIDRTPELMALTGFIRHLEEFRPEAALFQVFKWKQSSDHSAPEYGVMSQVGLNEGKETYRSLSTNDWVFIDTASFVDTNLTYEQQLRNLRGVIHNLTNLGVNIMLLDSQGGRDLRSETWTLMEENGYRRHAGNDYAWGFDPMARTYQNVIGERSRLTVMGARPVKNLYMDIVTNAAPSDEHQRFLVNPSLVPGILTRETFVVPTGDLANYNLPTGSQSRKLKAQFGQLMQDNDFVQHLMDLSKLETKKEKQDFARHVQKFSDWAISTANDDSVFPNDPETGDFVILWNPREELVLLNRLGHKLNKRDIEAQATQQFEGLSGTGIMTGVSISSKELNPNWTTKDGKLQNLYFNNRYGRVAEVHSQHPNLGVKSSDSGLKMTTSPLPDSVRKLLPTKPMFRGTDVVHVYDEKPDNNNDVAGRVVTMQRAFELFGHNPEASIAKVLFGEDMSKMNDEQRTAMRQRVHYVMKHLSQKLDKVSVDTVRDIYSNFTVRKDTSDLAADTLRHMGSFSGLSKEDLSRVVRGFKMAPNKLSLDAYTTIAVFLYLSAEGREWSDIAGFAGYAQVSDDSRDLVTRTLPELYTNMFDMLLEGSTARGELFQGFRDQFNTPEYFLREDWTLEFDGAPTKVTRNGQTVTVVPRNTGYLRLSEWHATGHSGAKYEHSEKRQEYENNSYHNEAFKAMSFGITPIRENAGWRTERFEQPIDQPDPDAEPLTVFEIFKDLNPHIDNVIKENEKRRTFTFDERQALRFQKEAVRALRKRIDTSKWTHDEQMTFDGRVKDALSAYGVENPSADYLIHFWVRQYVGMMVDSEGRNLDIGYSTSLDAVNKIIETAQEGRLPTFYAEIPMIFLEDLRILFRANQGTSPRFKLTNGGGSTVDQSSWDDWVSIAVGEEAFNVDGLVDPLFRVAIDGVWNSYMDLGGAFSDLPVSLSALEGNLVDGQIQVSFIAPMVEGLTDVQILDANRTTLDELIRSPRINASAEVSKESGRIRSRRNWRRETGANEMLPQSMADFKKHGSIRAHQLASDNAFMQSLVQLRVITTLANPGLPVSAIAEAMAWGTLSDVANIISGDSLTGFSALVSKTPERFKPLLENLFGKSRLTGEDIRNARQADRIAGASVDFRRMINTETYFRTPEGRGPITKALGKVSGLVSKVQDPAFGMNSTVLARRYQESALAWVLGSAQEQTVVSPARAIAEFKMDPLYYKRYHPEAHRVGLNAIEDTRGLQKNIWSMAIKGFVDKMTNSPSNLVGYTSTLAFQIPLLFSTYSMNVASKIFGMQGPNAAAAMLLHGRRIWGKKAVPGETSEDSLYFDMMPAIQSIDLTREFLQSGLSLTALFGFGLMSAGLGLTGEDEETKRRKRMAHYQGWQFFYDPREIENDWRNQDAIFLDKLGPLATLFSVTTGEDQRSMAGLHWIVQQFVAPMMGFERFMNTGDVRQIMWGFKHALNSFPILNMRTWNDANEMANEMASAAEEHESLGTPEDMAKSYGFLLDMVMSYERMLFENSFANSLYKASDDYDRDPFVMVERDEHGNIINDRLVNPEGTNALDTFQDEVSGEIRQGYTKNDAKTAAEMGRAENNLTYAVFKSLTTGNFDLSNSPWMRKNMAVKERKIALEGIDNQTAKDLILSVWNNETGREELTYDGARAILNGVAAKSVTLDSPALQGIFLTQDQRKQIEDDWFTDLIVQGVDVYGLSESKARQRTWDIWLGNGEYEGIGLRDILYSKQIPNQATAVYNQLQTTYIPGPDGQMWATGISRPTFASAMGLSLLQHYYTGGNQLGTDGRLNATDPVFNLNTGIRGLKRKEESYHIQTDEELMADSLDRLEKILDKNFDKLKEDNYTNWDNGYGNPQYRSRSWGTGSSGSGGGYAPKINTANNIREPYYKDARVADAGNPLIRRASIRRERYSSERGRLKQWQ